MSNYDKHSQERRGQCRLYKALAEVFDRRIDLTERQKHDLLVGCYMAAIEERRQAIERAVAAALTRDKREDAFQGISLGRKTS